ncbi:protrudin-like [Littorina saxatilis]|uniref:Protrudin n=1 Tax=Littorina saxatilis TaxID=31220 RepID=A0AAN9BQS3_9CAEN
MSKAKTRVSKPQAAPEPEKDKDNEVVLDLAGFVTQVERFSTLIEPFAFVFYCIDDIRRWRFPKFTILFWIIANICCFVLTQGAVFIVVSCLVIGIATVSLCQLHTRLLDKYLPQTKPDTVTKSITEEPNTLETIQNFQFSLIQMHDFIVKSNEYLTYIYAVLKWDDAIPAMIYHTEVCVSMLCLVVFPVRWNCFCFVNWFFLCHPVILKRGCSYWHNIMDSLNKKSGQSNGSVVSAVNEPKATTPPASANTTPSKQTPAAASQSTPVMPKDRSSTDLDSLDMDDKDDSSDVDLIEMTNTVDESLSKIEPPPQRPGMVARLMELKKRRSQMANENCHGCRVSFSSILKRRHYCRHCGNSFCHKCCNLKVPRSVFGATSPAASKETVLVCNGCHGQLATTGELSPPQGQKARAETS